MADIVLLHALWYTVICRLSTIERRYIIMDLAEVEQEVEQTVPGTPEHPEKQKQRAGFKVDKHGNIRVETRVSRYIRASLEPLKKRRMLGPELVQAAEEIGLVEAFKWLSTEELTPHEITAIIWVTPTERLLQKCARYYIGPQVFLRGAAIKLADKLERERLKRLVRGEE